MSQYLFIGGPADGQTLTVQHVELHHPHVVKVLQAPLSEVLAAQAGFSVETSVETVEYWPHRLWAGTEQETVYTTSRDEGINIIRALIAGYHKPEDYPDRAIELGRTFERQFFIDWCRRYLGYVPSRLKAYLQASLSRANQALHELRGK